MEHLVGTSEIADMLGVSRQRVAQIMRAYEDFPAPIADLASGKIWLRGDVERWTSEHPHRGPGRGKGSLFALFTDAARHSIVLAQAEARILRHDYIAPEHLLLGLIAEGDDAAARALARWRIALDDVRERVRSLIGEGTSEPEGRAPFTPRAKKILELARREALQLRSSQISTGHLLLGILREGEGVSAQIIRSSGRLVDLRKTTLDEMGDTKRALTLDFVAEAITRESPEQDVTQRQVSKLRRYPRKGSEPVPAHEPPGADRIADALERIDARLAAIEERLRDAG